ncbi:MAG: membrane protein insertion efficiency factor YidD [Desulfovibrio sp.]|jgi:putative membrane protein insertion efficiency factor|nr:membrane protein insertion efficiency factor YidD [Desulfovibrio sp.]
MNAVLSALVIFLLRFYQKCISPLFPGHCRFRPTCSHFAVEAVQTHGIVKGLYLAAHRLCRCHPWGGAGYDPVPPAAPRHPRNIMR